jgi:hypothetical protein
MLTLGTIIEAMENGRKVIAFHGTKHPEQISEFMPATSFSPNIEMAKRYIGSGGSYASIGPNWIYKVEIVYFRPYGVSTQERARETISKFISDRKFKKSLLDQGYDAIVYGIPSLDSDCVIAPLKKEMVKILDARTFSNEELNGGGYLTWAESADEIPDAVRIANSMPELRAIAGSRFIEPDQLPAVPPGYIRMFHGTDPRNVPEILNSGIKTSKEMGKIGAEPFVSGYNSPNDGFGDAIIVVDVPQKGTDVGGNFIRVWRAIGPDEIVGVTYHKAPDKIEDWSPAAMRRYFRAYDAMMSARNRK